VQLCWVLVIRTFISLSKTDTRQDISFPFATLTYKVFCKLLHCYSTALTERYKKHRVVVRVCVCVCVCVDVWGCGGDAHLSGEMLV
jgi:hypothetical protein